LRGGYSIFYLHDKIKWIAEFAAKENLKSSFPLRFKARWKGAWIFVSNVYPLMVSLARKELGFVVFFIMIGILGERLLEKQKAGKKRIEDGGASGSAARSVSGDSEGRRRLSHDQ
jgi:hypothetical protein